MISLRYYGDMGGCTRPRVGQRGLYYTKEQQAFRRAIRRTLDGVDTSSITDGPLHVRIRAYYKAPKSQKTQTIYKTTSPDVDNIEKPAYDSLFKLTAPRGDKVGDDGKVKKAAKRWDFDIVKHLDIDDSRIVHCDVRKYSTHNERLLGMSIDITNIDEFEPTYRQIFDELASTGGACYGFKGGAIDGQRDLGAQIESSWINGVAVYEDGDEITIIGRKGDRPWIVKLS